MGDNLIFEESINTEIDQSEFISKKWIYVNDNNSQNYTSQIILDTTQLSNSGGWINWNEGFIIMPLVVNLTSATAGSLPANNTLGNYSWAFKNSFLQMIHSMTIEFNNQNVIQQTPFLNVFRTFKCLTSWSQDDLFNEGPSFNFAPDNAGSWSFANDYSLGLSFYNSRGQVGIANNANGSVYSSFPSTSTYKSPIGANNVTYLPSTAVAGTPIVGATAGGVNPISYSGAGDPSPLFGGDYSVNDGMRKRQEWVNYDPTTIATSLGQTLINNNNTCQTNYRSAKVPNATAGSVVWNVYAKLRLKDMSDLFEKLPILKGSTFRFFINTNQAITTFTTTLGTITDATGAIASQPVLNSTSVNVIGGSTNPLMVAANTFGQGSSPLPADTYQISVSIVKNTFSSQTSVYGSPQNPLTACRLYAPIITLNPLAESRYLSLAPTKRVIYKDVFQYQVQGVPTGNFNFLVSNGLPNIVSCTMVPFISKSNSYTDGTGTVQTSLPFISYQNPFSTSPSTPDPIMLTNVNFLLSGVQVFLSNEYYDFEAFREQLIQSNQLNASLTTGLASGLINEDMFSRLYRYYYADCSRILPSEQGVSRAVQIQGQNVSNVAIDIMVFVEFEKSLIIDVSTGARIG